MPAGWKTRRTAHSSAPPSGGFAGKPPGGPRSSRPKEVFPMIYLATAAVLAVFYVLSGLGIAQEYERGVVFRLGRFSGVRGPGLYWLATFIERAWTLDLRTRTVTVEQQET